LAQTRALEVTGIDLDPAQIEQATAASRDIPNVSFRQADATRLPFADGAFDLVATNKTPITSPTGRTPLLRCCACSHPPDT
jgi:ubiquinone/menaquinone biosynthesis C-methylase UbiE